MGAGVTASSKRWAEINLSILLSWLLQGCSEVKHADKSEVERANKSEVERANKSEVERAYGKALAYGRKAIPYARQFHKLFPGARHFFSYYTGEKGRPTWNSKVGLHGRYVLTFQVKVTFDKTRTKVVGHGKPEFYLTEITRINPHLDGTTEILHGKQVHFAKKEWAKLFKKKGDLSVLGIKIVRDRPVKNFEQHWFAG